MWAGKSEDTSESFFSKCPWTLSIQSLRTIPKGPKSQMCLQVSMPFPPIYVKQAWTFLIPQLTLCTQPPPP
jgi:hypothetical protein